MCSALTENVVLTRTRSHDLKSVRKLNCWGCTLKDVSIVSRMPALEVISLSINSIDTLAYFASCTNLQELYLRENEIKNLNEILHLAQLQCLKKLSLQDNPCNQAENYRLTVLKASPTLEILDNVRVTPEEIYQAEKLGRDLSWPGNGGEEEDEVEKEVEDEVMLTEVGQTSELASNEVGEGRYSLGNGHDAGYHAHHQPPHSLNEAEPPSSSTSSAYHHASSTNLATNRMHTGGYPNNGRPNGNNTNMAKSNSLSDYNLYNNYGNYRGSSSSPPPSQNSNNYEPSVAEYNETGHYNNHNNSNGGPYMVNNSGGTPATPHPPHHHNHSLHGPNGLSGSSRTILSSGSSASQSAQSRLLPKGGKNRNANILSAVLCLIKELDYASLEVVDTTIHCRMEEMED